MNMADLPRLVARSPNRQPSRRPSRPREPDAYTRGCEQEIVRLLEVVRLLQEALALADQRFLERRMHRWRG